MKSLIGKRIKQLRKLKGLSQEKFARKIAIDRTYLSKIESGKLNITIDSLDLICKGLNIALKDFFDFNN